MEQYLFTHALILVVVLSGVPLAVSTVIGLMSSIFQAATQIQEPSLTFVPKVVGVSCILFFFGARGFRELTTFFAEILSFVGASR